MLISCPECNKQISDKAVSCPNCGYPIQEQQATQTAQPKKKNGRMRLPNGFGRITEIKGKNLRKPFRAMITDGKDEEGHPIGKLLKPHAYFKTYNEAYQALIEYNRNPYDYENDLTMQELYDKWLEYYTPKISKSRINAIKASWHYCDAIAQKSVQTIRTPDLKRHLDDAYKINKSGEKVYPSDNTRNTIKYTLSLMFDYAVEYGYTDRNYARDIRSGYGTDEAVNPHLSYSKEEMTKLWNYKEDDFRRDMLLVQCYMGWRPGELCDITTNRVNMTDWVIKGGSKTSAGKDRECVVHECIRPIIRKWYSRSVMSGSSRLFLKGKRGVTYEVYKLEFKDLIHKLGLNPSHRPHDGRKQFATMAKEAGVDPYAVKLMMGHAVKDLTERVYTDVNLKWLHKEIAKIKVKK